MIRTVRDLLLGLLVACVCSSSATDECKGCNIDRGCYQGIINITIFNFTEYDFKSEVNSSKEPINEGDKVTLECSHNIPDGNLNYTWYKDDTQTGHHDKTYFMEKVLSGQNGNYKCCVSTPCGSCESKVFNINIKNNSILILVVCGVSALALVLIMGVAMKIKLKKDQAQHKERMRQRQQDAHNAGPIPLPRGY
ncbi:uncharacterized protein V3H82_005754 [Fundulus diaphanus]